VVSLYALHLKNLCKFQGKTTEKRLIFKINHEEKNPKRFLSEFQKVTFLEQMKKII
jgi:hypothetical protein